MRVICGEVRATAVVVMNGQRDSDIRDICLVPIRAFLYTREIYCTGTSRFICAMRELYVCMYLGTRVSPALLYHRARFFHLIQQEMPRPLPSMKHQISFDNSG
jgi:hypothetical protein